MYGEGPAAQAQLLINAQLAPVAAPLVSAVPPGTTLRALYLNAKGEAYVDLSRDVVTGHTGGSRDELLTIYTIVNALTSNLPAVTSVQVLVDGKEVDTLAGHVDLRQAAREESRRSWNSRCLDCSGCDPTSDLPNSSDQSPSRHTTSSTPKAL